MRPAFKTIQTTKYKSFDTYILVGPFFQDYEIYVPLTPILQTRFITTSDKSMEDYIHEYGGIAVIVDKRQPSDTKYMILDMSNKQQILKDANVNGERLEPNDETKKDASEFFKYTRKFILGTDFGNRHLNNMISFLQLEYIVIQYLIDCASSPDSSSSSFLSSSPYRIKCYDTSSFIDIIDDISDDINKEFILLLLR